MNTKTLFESLDILGALTIIGVVLAAVVGWFMNIYALFIMAMSYGPDTNLLMAGLRVVGIFVAPLGGFLGLFF